jgi:hypothetical protein
MVLTQLQVDSEAQRGKKGSRLRSRPRSAGFEAKKSARVPNHPGTCETMGDSFDAFARIMNDSWGAHRPRNLPRFTWCGPALLLFGSGLFSSFWGAHAPSRVGFGAPAESFFQSGPPPVVQSRRRVSFPAPPARNAGRSCVVPSPETSSHSAIHHFGGIPRRSITSRVPLRKARFTLAAPSLPNTIA